MFVLQAFSLLLVAVALVAAAGLSWLLKDGLGPDAVESTGATAVARFLEGFSLPLIIGLVEGVVIFNIGSRRLHRLAEEGQAS